jgi:hypothetical protein
VADWFVGGLALGVVVVGERGSWGVGARGLVTFVAWMGCMGWMAEGGCPVLGLHGTRARCAGRSRSWISWIALVRAAFEWSG